MDDSIVRDESTPDGRETWAAVKTAADKAPQWLRRAYEERKKSANHSDVQEHSPADVLDTGRQG